jgi:3-oxoacyl-[acyl-carrier protein] reductase
MRLHQKVAVITGAAGGIGKGIAMQFAKEGARVVINDVSDEGELVASEIHESGGNALFVKLDIRSEENVNQLMQTAKSHFGGLHVLVNNAGVTSTTTVVTADDAEFERVIGLNLKSVWYCCKHAIPMMIEQGGGNIVNISSTHVYRTQVNHFPYHSAKAGMHTMTHGICIDYGKYGIRANNICPGFIETPMAEKWLQSFPNREEKIKAMLASHPVGRFGKPEDVANAAVFLASDESGFISGATIVVDGGRSVLQRSD